MKAGGARVYSVGVFADATPVNTRGAFNAYMHGVSSNYPNAEAYSDLGSRAENSNYYKAATDADELNGIFQEISDEINKGTGLPTHTTEGMANNSATSPLPTSSVPTCGSTDSGHSSSRTRCSIRSRTEQRPHRHLYL